MKESFRKNHERGLWYEIKTISENIKVRESMGMDASFEKELLASYKAYARGSGYHSPALDSDYNFDEAALNNYIKVESLGEDNISARFGSLGIMQQPKQRGRPIKEGEVNRSTTWRRKQKELQGVMV